MATSARHSGFVSYNDQSAVDTDTHRIVAHDDTNQGFNRDQPSPMAIAASADKGYFAGLEILACQEAGITEAARANWLKTRRRCRGP